MNELTYNQTRCFDDTCPKCTNCKRWLDRNTEDKRVARITSMRMLTAKCGFFIPAENVRCETA